MVLEQLGDEREVEKNEREYLTTPFQPEITSSLHSAEISSIVLVAMTRHFPIASFSSPDRLENGAFRSAELSKYGLWSMIRRFWNRHFIINRGTCKNEGIEASASVVSIVGRSSHQRTSSSSS
jgi:hypothetical protein